MKINNKQKQSKAPLAIMGVLVALLLSGSALGYYYYTSRNQSTQTKDQALEQQAGKKRSDSKVSQQTPTTNASSVDPKNQTNPGSSDTINSNATPFITYFGKAGSQVEVDAYVPNVIEDGTCNLTIRNGAAKVVYTASKPAHSAPQSTRCENFIFPDNGATSEWNAVVTFKSANYSGDSQPTKFTN